MEREKYYGQTVVEEEEYLDPLPPTPISLEARMRLRRWRVPDEYVDKLGQMTALFRYDRCPQKAVRVARGQGYVYKDDNDILRVVLPGFFDRVARLDGQCGDLANQMLWALNFSGFMTNLNETLTTRNKLPIDLCYATGLSRTHFNREGRSHVWVGLFQKGTAPEEMVLIDPSFQLITNLEVSDYRLKKESVVINPTDGPINGAISIMVTEYRKDDGKSTIWPMPRPGILGVSADRRFVYGVGFATGQKPNKFFPYITLTRDFGGEVTSCVLGDEGPTWCGPMEDVEEQHQGEVGQMLDTFGKMKIVSNPGKARKILSEVTTIRYQPQFST